MAKKVQPVDILPDPSSSDDQDASSSDTDDQQQTLNQESESDSDSEPIKPIVSKSPEPKAPTSKPAQGKSTKSQETDKATKPVSKSGNVKEGNNKRHAEVENVEKSKKSKVSNGEGQSVGKVDKSSKSKILNGEGQSVGKVENGSKSKISNGEGQSVGKVDKGSKTKILNGEVQSVGKVEEGSKSKKGTSGDDESRQVEEKKSLVKWSDEDEVKLLDWIVHFKAETGEDVNFKVDTFYDYAKDLFSVNLTKTQLYDKIKRLKKKFETNVDKWKNGEEPAFSRPHESKLYELSKKIWANEGTVTDGNVVVGNTGTPVEPVTGREHLVQEDTIMEDREEVTPDFWSLYPWLCASLKSEAAGYLLQRVDDIKECVKEIISGIGEEKARELENEWKAVHVMDHQLYARRAHLISKQAQAVSDSFN